MGIEVVLVCNGSMAIGGVSTGVGTKTGWAWVLGMRGNKVLGAFGVGNGEKIGKGTTEALVEALFKGSGSITIALPLSWLGTRMGA